MEKLKIKNLDVYQKKVLIRVDFNVPLDENQNITDDSRIVAALPTIQYVINNGGAAILMSHLGRPKGHRASQLCLAPIAHKLEEYLGQNVVLAPDSVGPDVQALADKLQPGEVLLLENLRFHEAETKPEKDPSFAKQLAGLGDIYVNDAFGTAHRSHSSTATITKYFPNASAAGFLVEKEINFLGKTLANPKKPFVTIIGGAKISTKIGVLKTLIEKVDTLLIGGGMAYTFFKAQGIAIGNSIHEDEFLDTARELIKACQSQGVELLLPLDLKIADDYNNNAHTQIIDIKDGIPEGWQGLDIGPKTVDLFCNKIKDSQTVLWNGPLGVFEFSNFKKGTNQIANTLAQSPATTIVAGGDCVSAVKASGNANNISHLSTGGGSTLEYIEYGSLPCIEALSDA
ncbi:MAG: phosphoglycerate kinase [Chlamydiota bacterium]